MSLATCDDILQACSGGRRGLPAPTISARSVVRFSWLLGDPELIGEVLEDMRDLARDGMTMIVVTYEMGFARKVADRVIFMDGACLSRKARRHCLTDPKDERTRRFLEFL